MGHSVYRIWSLKGDLVYYGSTSNKRGANQRWNGHTNKSNSCSSKVLFDTYGLKECQFQIIEECNTKEEALLREKWWICNNKCVNKIVPFLTEEEIKEKKKEYTDLHKDHKKEYDKKYREDKKEKHTLKIQCECGGFYQKKHRSSHLNTQLHQNYTTSPKQFSRIE